MIRSMQLLGLGVVIQMLADVVVGIRLLALARRTRQVPELGMGLCCLLLGGVGLPLALLVRSGALGPDERGVLLACALGVQNLACFALYVATWRVFRPGSKLARFGIGVAATALLWSTLGSTDDGSFAFWLGWPGRAGAFIWSAVEAAHYAHLLGRRVELGLADAVVADRMRLWALCCGVVSLGFIVFFVSRVYGMNPAETPALLVTASATGITGGVALWLAFLPPQWYRARFASRPAR
jgi:hypothetical protein